jgi:hypothetical protein
MEVKNLISIRPLAKVPKTPPPTPPLTKGRGAFALLKCGVGFFIFDLCKRSIV